MPIVFKYDDQSVDIEEVPLAVYGEIEKQTKVPWYDLAASPMRHAVAGELLAKECAKIAGVDLPPLTPRLLVKVFDVVKESNVPTEFEDGMPDPKAKGSEPETT